MRIRLYLTQGLANPGERASKISGNYLGLWQSTFSLFMYNSFGYNYLWVTLFG